MNSSPLTFMDALASEEFVRSLWGATTLDEATEVLKAWEKDAQAAPEGPSREFQLRSIRLFKGHVKAWRIWFVEVEAETATDGFFDQSPSRNGHHSGG